MAYPDNALEQYLQFEPDYEVNWQMSPTLVCLP
jgi:hypothetical protein